MMTSIRGEMTSWMTATDDGMKKQIQEAEQKMQKMQNKRSGNFRDFLIKKRSSRESQLKILQNRSSSRDELISATCYPVLLPLPAIYVLRTANMLLLPTASYCLLLSQRLHLCGSPSPPTGRSGRCSRRPATAPSSHDRHPGASPSPPLSPGRGLHHHFQPSNGK